MDSSDVSAASIAETKQEGKEASGAESSSKTDKPGTGLAPVTPGASSVEEGALETSTQGVGQTPGVSLEDAKEVSANATASHKEGESSVSQDTRVSTASTITLL